MTIRAILVPIAGDESDAGALAAALAAARAFEAHIHVLHVRPQPSAALIAGSHEGTLVAAEIFALLEGEATERAQRARTRYEAWRDAAKISEGTTPTASRGVSTSWSEVEGPVAATVARLGRVADLVVLGAPAGRADAASSPAIEGALFDSGRPILLTAEVAASASFDSVVIAWNGSAEAAAAVGGALPFLAQAKRIHVFAAAERGEEPRLPTDFIEYLSWHGIAATVRTVTASPANVGVELLREAELVGGTLIVMGGYTHGRLRQLIFGGATSHALRHATIPLLMAH